MDYSVKNRLTYLSNDKPHVQPSGAKKPKIICLCTCGKKVSLFKQHFLSGHTKSCGCLDTEKKTKHGLYYNDLYSRYYLIKARCKDVKRENNKHYGGRGIKCEWNSFEEFYKDMSPTYKKGLQIDRIDTNKNYTKQNCRWVTPKQNSSNKRNNVIFKKETATDASIRLGGAYSLVSGRINNGWSIKKAFTQPINKNKSHARRI